jgi:hypothetical protein
LLELPLSSRIGKRGRFIMKQVLLVRLDSTQGFGTFADGMALVHKLAQHDIPAVCEPAPGAPMEGVEVFNIMIDEEHFVEAKAILDMIQTEGTI